MAATGIVTVLTNETHNLLPFYNSLASQTDKDITLYLIDNNSSDDPQAVFNKINKENLINCVYHRLSSNTGFSGGSNRGSELAIKDNCRYLLILNNDVVMESECVEELRKLAEADEKTACTGMLLMKHKDKYPGIIQEYGGKINFKNGTLKKYHENDNINNVKLPEVIETDFVGGGAMFIKADVFKKAGMFEEDYFGYFDEMDLSYRLKVKHGYRMFVTSHAKAYHNHYSASAGNKRTRYYFEYYLSERNKFLFYDKFGLSTSKYKMLFTDIMKFPVRILWFRKVCGWKLGWYYLRGMWDGLRGVKGKPGLEFK